jgi:hypothetical protein
MSATTAVVTTLAQNAEAEAEQEQPTAEQATVRKLMAAPTPEMFDFASIGVKVERPRKPSKKFSAVLYSPPKIGKTSLIGTCADVPELCPVLVLAIEDGSSVLDAKYGDDENLDVINCEDWPTAARVITAVAEGRTRYKTIGVDTISELQELMKEHCNEEGYGLWSFIADETIKVVKMLHRSPHVNVIFTTHAEKIQDTTGKILNSPYFLGKKALGEVLKPIDLILYLAVTQDKTTGEPMRVLLTKPDGKNDAGDRTGKLDMYIPNPNFAEIYAQMKADEYAAAS